MKKKYFRFVLLVSVFLLTVAQIYAQGVGVNSSGNPPDPSAIFDASATDKGLLIPRLSTSQRDAINSPAEGLMVFNTTTKCFEAYVNNYWGTLSCPCPTPFTPAAGVHSAQQTEITWNWTSVSGATGYKYNTINDYLTATDYGPNTSLLQSGLSCNSSFTLYVWAYNVCGYSLPVTLTQFTSECGATCGTQVWAATNINVGTRINGLPGGFNMTAPGGNQKYCFNDIEANCTTYGGMYEWGEMMNYASSINCDPCGGSGAQGICPSGYHIPTDLEWSRYEYCVENTIAPTGSTSLASFQTGTGYRGSGTAGVAVGDKLKAASPTWDGTNGSGFNALPGGYRYNSNGVFDNLGLTALFWTATENTGSSGWLRSMDNTVYSNRSVESKALGISVRCLKN